MCQVKHYSSLPPRRTRGVAIYLTKYAAKWSKRNELVIFSASQMREYKHGDQLMFVYARSFTPFPVTTSYLACCHCLQAVVLLAGTQIRGYITYLSWHSLSKFVKHSPWSCTTACFEIKFDRSGLYVYSKHNCTYSPRLTLNTITPTLWYNSRTEGLFLLLSLCESLMVVQETSTQCIDWILSHTSSISAHTNTFPDSCRVFPILLVSHSHNIVVHLIKDQQLRTLTSFHKLKCPADLFAKSTPSLSNRYNPQC